MQAAAARAALAARQSATGTRSPQPEGSAASLSRRPIRPSGDSSLPPPPAPAPAAGGAQLHTDDSSEGSDAEVDHHSLQLQ